MPMFSCHIVEADSTQADALDADGDQDMQYMTNEFGVMLLDKFQQSHDHMQEAFSEFMTKQTQSQTQFWYARLLRLETSD